MNRIGVISSITDSMHQMDGDDERATRRRLISDMGPGGTYADEEDKVKEDIEMAELKKQSAGFLKHHCLHCHHAHQPCRVYHAVGACRVYIKGCRV